MNEYIVTLTTRRFFGTSKFANRYAIHGDSMKDVKDYIRANFSHGLEVVACTAHKVKQGEVVPDSLYSWIYQ